METKAHIHYCDDCRKPFVVPGQDSRRRLCPVCLEVRMTRGHPKKEEEK